MGSSKKLKLKIVVDKEKKRVVFAEADKDFVDILFSFLTLPVGRIIHLLGKQTSLGCMDKLYESVEKLDERYFQTEVCKSMLLQPLNASRCENEHLAVSIETRNPRIFYKCRKPECCINSYRIFSNVPNSKCGCGQILDFESRWEKKDLEGSSSDGVFVKEIGSFIVTDDLHVMPSSTESILNLIEKHGIEDGNMLDETTITLGVNELQELLSRSLRSKSPLSGIYYEDPVMTDNTEFRPKFNSFSKIEEVSPEETKKTKVKFLVCTQSNKVIYAEARAAEGLVDVLFSFLTFPLGCIVKLLEKSSSIGCIDNLYNSVEDLSVVGDCLKSDDCKNMLLAPKLAPYFGLSYSPIPNVELSAGSGNVIGCQACFLKKESSVGTDACKHGVKHVNICEMNPKRVASKEVGGGYANEAMKFMITDDLQVTPFSAVSSIQTAKEQQVSFTSLEEREICIGTAEALTLLRFCLTSQCPLSNLLMQK